MALGPVAGGLIYDAFTSYVGLFRRAFALGLGPSLAAVVFAIAEGAGGGRVKTKRRVHVRPSREQMRDGAPQSFCVRAAAWLDGLEYCRHVGGLSGIACG